MYDDESQSIFVFRNPLRFLSRKGRQIGAYLSGGLVCTFFFQLVIRKTNFEIKLAIGWWVFIDAVINSSKYNGTSHMGFEDWFSGILTTFGMIV
jgi:hypothetical protein